MDIFDKQNKKIIAIDTRVQEIESGLLYRMSEVDKKLKILTDLEQERKGQVAHNHGLIDSLF